MSNTSIISTTPSMFVIEDELFVDEHKKSIRFTDTLTEEGFVEQLRRVSDSLGIIMSNLYKVSLCVDVIDDNYDAQCREGHTPVSHGYVYVNYCFKNGEGYHTIHTVPVMGEELSDIQFAYYFGQGLKHYFNYEGTVIDESDCLHEEFDDEPF